MSLQARLAVRFALAAPSAWVVLFLPAGSAWFWQGWLFLLFVLLSAARSSVVGAKAGSGRNCARTEAFQRLWTPLWACALAIPGLDYRFGWSAVPVWLTLVSQAMLLCAYFLIFLVLRVNTYASRVVRVEEEQRVVSSGPYRVVRHPMYSALLILILFTPLALGSYRALPAFALLIPLLIFRLLNEERILRKGLSGYSHYCSRTRFRLVPFLL